MKKIVSLAEYKDKVGQTEVKKKPQKHKNKIRRWLKLCLWIILAILCLYGILHSPLFVVDKIMVEGNKTVNSDKIIALSEITEGQQLLSVKRKNCAKNIAMYPFVDSAQVQYRLPDTVIIKIVERAAVGMIVTEAGYIQVSADGRMLAIQPNVGEYNLPVISGIKLDELPSPGQVIQNEYLNQALKIISSGDPQLLNNIAELNVGEKNYILAYTNKGIEIRLGDISDIEKRLMDLNDILQNIVTQRIAEKDIEYIDIRYQGAPIIKMKELSVLSNKKVGE